MANVSFRIREFVTEQIGENKSINPPRSLERRVGAACSFGWAGPGSWELGLTNILLSSEEAPGTALAAGACP